MLLIQTANPATRKMSEPTEVLLLLPDSNRPSELREALRHSHWRVSVVTTLDDVTQMLRSQSVPVLLCEADLSAHLWKDLVQRMKALPSPPNVILASQQVDTRLWFEALSSGVYGVLSKPLDRADIFRTISLAWRHWQEAAARARTGFQREKACTSVN